MKAIHKTLFSLATALLLAVPAVAADITLKVGANNQLTLTNNLAQTVYLKALVSDSESMPILMQLDAGRSEVLLFSGAVPFSLSARGLAVNGALDGHTPTSEGYYDLSVSIE